MGTSVDGSRVEPAHRGEGGGPTGRVTAGPARLRTTVVPRGEAKATECSSWTWATGGGMRARSQCRGDVAGA